MMDRTGQQLGNYRLLGKLGEGGFAHVYLGEHIHLKTKAAIKVLDGKLTLQDVRAFQTEAQTIAALKHPHILPILDFGFDEAIPFLVMAYAPGGTLRDSHPRGSILSFRTILRYTQPLVSALQYAHNARVIHRDVKPENILIAEQGTLLLGDFGIAALSHSTASMKTMDSSGTPQYMAPELFQGKPCEASDQYALAILIYEWLAGRPPFQGENFFAIGMQHFSTPVPSLSARNPLVSSQVEQVLFKALAKDPKNRFPTIQDFADGLEQAIEASENAATYVNSSPQSQSFVRPSKLESRSQLLQGQPVSDTDDEETLLPEPDTRPRRTYQDQTPHPSEKSAPTRSARKRSPLKNLLFVLIGFLLVPLILLMLNVFPSLIQWVSTTFFQHSASNVFQMTAVVGHNDSTSNPSVFFALNLQGQAVVVELPGGDAARAIDYAGPQLQDTTTAVSLRFQNVTGGSLPDMILYAGQSKEVWQNSGTSFQPQMSGPARSQELPGPVSSNVNYPLSWSSAVVGHNDSSASPTDFLAANIRGQIVIIEFPSGNLSRVRDYAGPDLIGAGEEQLAVTLSFSDANNDGKVDMIVHVSDKQFIFYNNGTSFAASSSS